MPNRILRDGILTSEAVDALSIPAEVFYRRLMSVVDDFGRYYAKPGLLRAACYPLRLDKVDDTDVVRFLAELCNTKPDALAVVYEVVGKQFVQMLKFRQKIRAKKSKFPEPPADVLQMLSMCTTDALLGGDGGEDVCGGEDVVEVEGVISAKADSERPKTSAPACPHVEIIKRYAERLPMGRQVRPELWNGSRAKHLQARWREDSKRQTVQWWDEFFEYVAKSQFLTGRAHRPGRDPFQVSLGWLVEPENFAKVMEGAYER